MPGSDEIIKEQESAHRAYPVIIRGLVEKQDLSKIAKDAAAEAQVSELTSWRWTSMLEEQFLSARKKAALAGNLLFVPGAGSAAVIAFMYQAGKVGSMTPAGIALLFGLAGLGIILSARKIAGSMLARQYL